MVRHAIYNLLLPELANIVLPQRLPLPISTLFKPADITGLQAHFDATQITGLVNLDPVTTWPDTSGNARNASQATTAKKPQYRTNAQNGKPVVRFDGVDDVMLMPLVVSGVLNYSVIAVITSIEASERGAIFASASTGGSLFGMGLNDMDTAGNELLAANNAVRWIDINTTVTTGAHILGWSMTDSAGSLRTAFFVDGTERGADIGGLASAPSGTSLLFAATETTRFFGADLCELLVYSPALSTADRQKIEAHLRDKWGITFKPSDVPGLQFHADATAITGLANLDPVTTWPDMSGFGRNASEVTAAKQPTYRTNIQTGKPVVRFDGVDDVLTAAFTLNQPTEIFSVHRYRSARAANDTAFDGKSRNMMRLFRGDGTTFGAAQMYAGASGPYSNLANVELWHTYRCLFNGISSQLSIDGGTAITGDPGLGNGGGVTLGNTGDGFNEPGPVDIAEILIYSGAVSDDNRAKILTYLREKWGTP